MANILFQDKVSSDFISKVGTISFKLGIDPSWLMFIMNHESGFSPSIQNSIGATGLIQFLPSTAIGLGTTTDALKSMDAVTQLDYVYKFLKTYQGKMVDYYTTYLAVFYPKALNQPDTFVFPSDVVSANPSLFITGGNTLADFKTSLDNIVGSVVPSELQSSFFTQQNGNIIPTTRNIFQVYQYKIIIGVAIAIVLIMMWVVWKKFL